MTHERRQFQIGPTLYVAKKGQAGWYVEATWWQATWNDEEEDFSERVTGPMSMGMAETRAMELNAERAAIEEDQSRQRREACASSSSPSYSSGSPAPGPIKPRYAFRYR